MMFIRFCSTAAVVAALGVANDGAACPPSPIAIHPPAPSIAEVPPVAQPVNPSPSPAPIAPQAPWPLAPVGVAAFAPAMSTVTSICAPVASYAAVAAPCAATSVFAAPVVAAPALLAAPVVASPAFASTVVAPGAVLFKPRLRDRLAAHLACKSTAVATSYGAGGKVVVKQRVTQRF